VIKSARTPTPAILYAERRDVQLKESAAESKPNCGYVPSNGVTFTDGSWFAG